MTKPTRWRQKPLSVQSARRALRDAMQRAREARGEAQWTNGYRAGRQACGAESEAEDQRLYEKEAVQWQLVGSAEANVELALRAYTRAVRAAK
jgi:hypothetical protein